MEPPCARCSLGLLAHFAGEETGAQVVSQTASVRPPKSTAPDCLVLRPAWGHSRTPYPTCSLSGSGLRAEGDLNSRLAFCAESPEVAAPEASANGDHET